MKSPIIQAEMQKMLLTSIIEELKSEFGEDIPTGNIEIMITAAIAANSPSNLDIPVFPFVFPIFLPLFIFEVFFTLWSFFFTTEKD